MSTRAHTSNTRTRNPHSRSAASLLPCLPPASHLACGAQAQAAHIQRVHGLSGGVGGWGGLGGVGGWGLDAQVQRHRMTGDRGGRCGEE